MTTINIDSGIFAYARTWERQFEGYLDMIEHGERKTTFIRDLSLAEPMGIAAIKDTNKRILQEWIDNVPYIAEYIMSLNFKCNMWHAHSINADDERMKAKCKALSDIYTDLFYKAQDAAYKHHEHDEEAVSYLFHYLD